MNNTAQTKPTKTPKIDLLQHIIETAGGKVDKNSDPRLVEKPGVMLLSESRTTSEAQQLFRSLNINQNQLEYLQIGEFQCRITYLSFREQPASDEEVAKYHDKMLNQLKHYSPYASTHVTILVAGCTLETELEFVSHHEFSIARLTSSNTEAMDETLYRIMPDKNDVSQYNVISAMVDKRANKSYREYLGRELSNQLNLCNKCVAFCMTGSIKDFHKLFIGRMQPTGNETEVREICSMIANILHERYPQVIWSPEKYASLNDNGEKLNMQ